MSFRKFSFILVAFTLITLLYVKLQLQITQLNYTMANFQREFKSQEEKNNLLSYEVSTLKSPLALEEKLKTSGLNLKFYSDAQTVKLPPPSLKEQPQ